MPRWTLLTTACLLITGSSALAQGNVPLIPAPTSVTTGLSITVPSVRQVRPGTLVTLNFIVTGRGEFDFIADGGPDWLPVNRTRRMTVQGNTLIPVTFRVPPLARPGQSPPLVLQVVLGGQVVSSAQAVVEVLPQARLALSSPVEITGQEGQRVNFPVEVTNLGNQPDIIELKITNVDERPQLSESRLALQPGERRTVSVSLLIERASSNYRFVTYLQGTSSNDQQQVARTRTELLVNPAARVDAANAPGPQLQFAVRSGLDAGMNWSPEGRSAYLRYRLQPRVQGQLSDYADADSSLLGLEGSDARWLPSGLSLAARVNTDHWTFGVSLSRYGLSAQGSVQRGAWKFSPRLSALSYAGQRTYSAGLGITGKVAGGDLNVESGTRLTRDDVTSQRQDYFNVNYARNLTPQLGLMVAASASGAQQDGTYRASLLGYQQLSYNTAKFDITQSYSGSLAGVHTFGLTGGLRAIKPFGVRGGLVAQLQPAGVTYSASGLILASLPGGFGASLSGRYQTSTIPGKTPGWQATAGLSTPTLGRKTSSVRGSVAYLIASDEDQPGARQQAVTATTTLNVGAWQNELTGAWRRDPKDDGLTEESLNLGLSSRYVTRRGDTLTARYDYQRLTWPSIRQQHSLLVGWERQWTPKFSSQISYQHAWYVTSQQPSSSDALDVAFSVQDPFIKGLLVSTSYRLSAPAGFSNGDYRHAVKVSLSYDLNLAFNTPKRVVDFFGGRIGGEVSGVLYQDTNLNNIHDPGEAGLGGVTVVVGDVKAVSSADGSYKLRAPVGEYQLAFPSGLPATLEALVSAQASVQENSTTTLDVPFAPVSNVEVLAFSDRNRNAKQDEGEDPLPYVGAQLSGPVNRQALADSRGYARFSAVPTGTYYVTLPVGRLPEGYLATGEAVQVQVTAGVRGAPIALGAAPPQRQTVTTFTASNIALIGALNPGTAAPGSQVKLTLRVQNASSVQVQALGQTYTPELRGSLSELTLKVPEDTPAGVQDITVTASGSSGQKTTILKLIIAPAESGSGQPP